MNGAGARSVVAVADRLPVHAGEDVHCWADRQLDDIATDRATGSAVDAP